MDFVSNGTLLPTDTCTNPGIINFIPPRIIYLMPLPFASSQLHKCEHTTTKPHFTLLSVTNTTCPACFTVMPARNTLIMVTMATTTMSTSRTQTAPNPITASAETVTHSTITMQTMRTHPRDSSTETTRHTNA